MRTRRGALYTGIATDVARRFREHRDGGALGAKYLRSQGPLELVYQVEVGSRVTALRAELRVKRLRKPAKETIVADQPSAELLLARLGLARS